MRHLSKFHEKIDTETHLFGQLCSEEESRCKEGFELLSYRVEEGSQKKAQHMKDTKGAVQSVIDNSLSTSIQNISTKLTNTERQVEDDVSTG